MFSSDWYRYEIELKFVLNKWDNFFAGLSQVKRQKKDFKVFHAETNFG